MKRFTLITAAVALIVVTLLLQAQTNVTGYWVFRIPRANGDGTFQESFFELKQDGDTVTGRAILGNREAPISDGTLKDGALHFSISLPGRGGANPTRAAYDGKLSGAKFSMTAPGRGGNPITGDFERTKKEATMPPAPLPLPA